MRFRESRASHRRGAFYAFPKLTIEQEDEQFVRELIKATGVVTVHGSGFGQRPGTKHFRIVFLPPEETLKKAYGLIGEFMSDSLNRHTA